MAKKKAVSTEQAAAPKKRATKKVAAKKAPAKKATKKVAAKKEAGAKIEGLSKNQVVFLGVLVGSEQPLSYNEIRTASGVDKGLSKAVSTGESSLVAQGLAQEVSVEAGEGERQVKKFQATAKGKKTYATAS